ncbi:MAG: hypothetical protein KIG33_08965 [Oscillospiraceae bacterium]|nr:hypothetical protein [Oscillospiraceae bacterium]
MHILVVEDERALCDTLIYRMLFNLIENAIRYNRPDSRVQISVSEKNDDVLIRVKDNGFGVPEQYRESIFQPFFRVDKSRSREHGGVGLGLALVWEIASLHGGSLSLPTFADCGQLHFQPPLCKGCLWRTGASPVPTVAYIFKFDNNSKPSYIHKLPRREQAPALPCEI